MSSAQHEQFFSTTSNVLLPSDSCESCSAQPVPLPHSKMAKLEELEEVDLSGNMLKTVPTTIMNCRRMHTLIAHSNSIEVFPEVMQLMEMKVRGRLRCARVRHAALLLRTSP